MTTMTKDGAAVVPTRYEDAREAGGPKGCVLFGSLGEFRADALKFYRGLAREFPDLAKIILVQPAYVVFHPDGVKRVLQDNHVNYKKNFIYDRMKPLLGEGLLTSNGDFWRRQRRLAQPAFHRARIAAFAELMVKHTEAMLARWEEHAKSGEPFDVHADMMKLTFVVVGEALFSIDLVDGAEDVGRALTTALDILNDRFTSIFIAPKVLPTPQNRKFAAALEVLDEMVQRIITERRASGKLGDDLLGMLMAARDEETGEGMSDRQLRDEVMTMVLAGHETTANAMSWLWTLLSKNPAVGRTLHEEVARVLGGRAVTMEDLPKLAYTTQVIQETMRLYPPAWAIGREAIEDDVILGYRIPAGSNVILVPYMTHRRPELWENPEGFDPDRFAGDDTAGRPRFAYFPFAAGPRMCIGSAFAMMEMQIVVSMVASRFKLALRSGEDVVPDPSVTLRPADGLPMVAKRWD